ncbi:MAG: GTP cyclohydrolase I, partial [Sedimentisphaerales bacterium]
MNDEVDTDKIEKAVGEILAAIGEETDREGLKCTPERVARMYVELLAGMREDPKRHLHGVFT